MKIFLEAAQRILYNVKKNVIRDKKDRIGRHMVVNTQIIGVPKGINQNNRTEKKI